MSCNQSGETNKTVNDREASFRSTPSPCSQICLPQTSRLTTPAVWLPTHQIRGGAVDAGRTRDRGVSARSWGFQLLVSLGEGWQQILFFSSLLQTTAPLKTCPMFTSASRLEVVLLEIPKHRRPRTGYCHSWWTLTLPRGLSQPHSEERGSGSCNGGDSLDPLPADLDKDTPRRLQL